MFSLFLLFACTPTFIEHEDINRAVAQKDLDTLCVGLSMPDDSLRTLATEQLRTFKDDKVAECICEKLPHAELGFDPAIAAGMKGEQRNAVARCFTDLVTNKSMKNRLAAIESLGTMITPVVLGTLNKMAQDTGNEPEIRAKSIAMISMLEEHIPTAIEAAKDSSPVVRAAAMEMIANHPKDKHARKVLRKGVDDEDGGVRAAALVALKRHVGSKTDEQMCKAILGDPDPRVRKAAILSYKDIKRPAPVHCLRKRALELEEDPEVRDALLEVLKSAKNDARASSFQVLCDAIPFWLRSYVVDDVVTNLQGVGIVKAQNDVDWKNSARCFSSAYTRSAGYSCYARMHIALWYAQVIGKENMKIPLCPDMEEYSE